MIYSREKDSEDIYGGPTYDGNNSNELVVHTNSLLYGYDMMFAQIKYENGKVCIKESEWVAIPTSLPVPQNLRIEEQNFVWDAVPNASSFAFDVILFDGTEELLIGASPGLGKFNVPLHEMFRYYDRSSLENGKVYTAKVRTYDYGSHTYSEFSDGIDLKLEIANDFPYTYNITNDGSFVKAVLNDGVFEEDAYYHFQFSGHPYNTNGLDIVSLVGDGTDTMQYEIANSPYQVVDGKAFTIEYTSGTVKISEGSKVNVPPDTTAPQIISASIFNDSSAILNIEFSEVIGTTDVSAFSIKGSSAATAVADITYGGKYYELTLNGNVVAGEQITISYDANIGTLADKLGNKLASFVDFPVMNLIQQPATQGDLIQP